MAVQIQFRNDLAANWTSVNPTLAQGEFGLETDTGQFKIGTGNVTWEDLAYGGIVGEVGPAGPDGVPGPQGPSGETVFNSFLLMGS